jgi:hypothetical protein
MPEFSVQRANGRKDIIVSDSLAGAERDSGGAVPVELDAKTKADMEAKAAKERVKEGGDPKDYKRELAGASTEDDEDGKPSLSWTRDKLAAFLTEKGGTVGADDTKADILKAIEASS